ncbi:MULTISPECIES: peroxiredoxin [unclassified Moraxella]|uniref:peroxiredoxin n=1 Tax=unclassified Moraxella TaxID=2685852 RepID=UPI003AF61156
MPTLPNFTVQLVQAVDENFEQFSHPTLTLTDFITQQQTGLILYFYPKDNTAGCSVQAQDFSEHQQALQQLGFSVIGVSRDSVKSHEKFIANKQINFPLVSDTEQQLCKHFGVIGEKNMYGKKVLGVVRSTFVFDKQGNLLHEFRNVRAKGHLTALLETLKP